MTSHHDKLRTHRTDTRITNETVNPVDLSGRLHEFDGDELRTGSRWRWPKAIRICTAF